MELIKIFDVPAGWRHLIDGAPVYQGTNGEHWIPADWLDYKKRQPLGVTLGFQSQSKSFVIRLGAEKRL